MGCTGIDGGLFDEGASATYSSIDSIDAASTANDVLPNVETDAYGSDTLRVNSTLSISNFPFGVRHGQEGDLALQNWIGLGRNSTLLNALVAKGAISSRVYGFWTGLMGAESLYQMDGNLVLGGYDAAKISGESITLPVTRDDSCPSGNIVSITNIKLSLPNGSEPSILGSAYDEGLAACVVPSHAVLDLPESVWDAFVATSGMIVSSAGRSYGYGWHGMLVDVNGS